MMEKKHSTISLIPGGCPQFLDFEVCITDLPRVVRHFKEEKKVHNTAVESRYEHYLRCIVEEDGEDIDQLTGEACDRDYSFDTRRVLDVWKDAWIPLPFLRTRGQKWDDGAERFEYGPSNWVRARMTQKDADTLSLTLIFDTNVEELPTHSIKHEAVDGQEDFSGEQYYALSPRDVAAHGTFALAHHVRDNAWFLNASWIDTWLLNVYTSYETKKNRGRPNLDEVYVLKHLASYLTWLEIVRDALRTTTVQVINPEREQPVEVDLILDIGNSRTTGILVETLPQRVTNLNDSYLLELRDITKPENIYSDPFETRVEFAEAHFGDDALSRRSGRRTPAFAWPSAVRVGPEAARLATHAICAEGSTGMSSPKRYLWDERPWQQTWRYNTGGPQEPMVTRGLFPRQVNREGTPTSCFNDPMFKNTKELRHQVQEPAFESMFTRSSLMLFMVGEIITQALVTINSPAIRSRRELPNMPRRLRRILFTVPTAMPVAEKRIFRRWVSWAVRVIWEALSWNEWYVGTKAKMIRGVKDYRTSPQVRCDWDEASCSQIVYIYNELAVKYHGDAHYLFNLLGKKRKEYENKPCVRIASIDTGGGTMDLSIATYELASGEGDTAHISPHMEFRDGFNIAGDEVLRDMVAQHIIPCLTEAFSKAGVVEPRTLIGQLFGRDAIGISQDQRNLRARFVRQVAVPVALGMLGLCEILYQNNTEIQENHPPFTCKFGDFFACAEPAETVKKEQDKKGTEEEVVKYVPFGHLEDVKLTPSFFYPMPQKHIIHAVEQCIKTYLPAHATFSLMDVELRVNPNAVENTIRSTLGSALAALCEIVHLQDCDVLLLTGRPSAWNGIISPVLAKLPVPMHRILPMRQYHVGNWYPFADVHGRITDPKTTVVVGAILCALAEGNLEGFSFDVSNLQLQSTARYVGELDINGQLRRPKVWFEVDVDDTNEIDKKRFVSFGGPLPIGYRQVDAERWPTTRYYLLTFSTEEARARASGRLPYQVEVALKVSSLEDTMESNTDEERDEGDFEVLDIKDKNDEFVSRADLEFRLQTLPLDEGYWLDTGIINNS